MAVARGYKVVDLLFGLLIGLLFGCGSPKRSFLELAELGGRAGANFALDLLCVFYILFEFPSGGSYSA